MTVGRRDFAGRQAGRLAAVAAIAGFLSTVRRADAADTAIPLQGHGFQPGRLCAPVGTLPHLATGSLDDSVGRLESPERA